MSDSTLLLGIDLGTSSCKAVLVAVDGVIVAEASRDYPIYSPRPLWSEQNPDDWWRGVAEAIRDVITKIGGDAARIRGIGLTGQMHGLVLLDRGGTVLRSAILWNDQRTQPQCDRITRRLGVDQLLANTGNIVLPGFTAPKLEWVREHEPAVFASIAHILLPKDYIRFRLAGEYATDVSDASGTSLFNVAARQWSDEMLQALDVPHAWLPTAFESAEISGRVTAPAAAETGLTAGIPVVAGAGDQAAAAIGAGIVRDGDTCVTLGTSGVVFTASETHRVAPGGVLHAFCHAVPNTWHLMGVMLSAGGSLHWWRDVLRGADRSTDGDAMYAAIIDEAARISAGSESLIFLPYLSGERTPHADPLARGGFIGLTTRHGRGHMTRAVLEGVAMGLCDSLDLIRGVGIRPNVIHASGGGARSAAWRQIMADVFGVNLITANATQGGAFGAALLAGVGVGCYSSVKDACQIACKQGDMTTPSAAGNSYPEIHASYRALYPALRASFHRTAIA